MSLVGYCDAAPRKDAILDCLIKKVVNFGPIWSRHSDHHQQSQQIMHQHSYVYNPIISQRYPL